MGAYENDQLAMTVGNDGAASPRYTARPVKVRVDDRLVRTFRVAVDREKPQQTLIPLWNLAPGEHQVSVSTETSEGTLRQTQKLPGKN